jgi:magnesium-transporting ATPase (P-type)
LARGEVSLIWINARPGILVLKSRGEVCMNVLPKLAAPQQDKWSHWPPDDHLSALSRLQPVEACVGLDSRLEGHSHAEAELRLKKFGPNQITREHKATILQELWGRARNPLNALLLTLAAVSYFLGDVRAAVLIAVMVILAITTAFVQVHRSNAAAAALRAMVHTTASVRRGPSPSEQPFSEIPIERLVFTGVTATIQDVRRSMARIDASQSVSSEA